MKRTLIPAAFAELREQWIRSYHEVERKLAKARREWNAYENEASEQYQQWYHQVFGPVLSELTRLAEAIHEMQLLLSAVEEQIRVNGLTRREALERVMEAIAEKRDPYPTEEELRGLRERERRAFKERFAKKDSRKEAELDDELLDIARSSVQESLRESAASPPRDPYRRAIFEETITAAIREIYEKLLSERASGIDIDENGPRLHERYEPESEQPEQDSAQALGIKAAYRRIVRILHPDRGFEMTPEEKVLWNETQDAYERGDLDTLRTILLRLETDGKIDVRAIDSIGEIMELTRALQVELEEINRRKGQVRKGPVYRFWASRTRPKNRETLRDDIKSELAARLFYANKDFRELSHEVDRLKRSIRSLKKDRIQR